MLTSVGCGHSAEAVHLKSFYMIEDTQIEFEIKGPAPKGDALSLLIGESDPASEYRQVDVYYDRPDHALYRKGVFIRVRDNEVLDIKYNPNTDDTRHLVCNETRFPFPMSAKNLHQLTGFLSGVGLAGEARDFENFESLANSFDISPWVEIQKDRTVYDLKDAEVCIDEVNGLGQYVEIEVIDPESNDKYVEWAAKNGLSHLAVGYVELYLRKHDFSTYMLGRYIFPDDRQVDY